MHTSFALEPFILFSAFSSSRLYIKIKIKE
jgi:hypothetical protein